MNKQFSQYLDLLRITAAGLVLLKHVCDPTYLDNPLWLPDELGYSAVMIFFVLSGYVIAYVACEREFTLLDFSISRISRIYSVVLPAIALTVIVDLLILGMPPLWHAPELYRDIPAYQYSGFPKYAVMSLLFANEAWGLRETLFSNGTYWSMCFEVYYYVLFAAAFYFHGISRIALVTLVLLIIGPGPVLRLHLWLFGAGIYFLHRHIFMSQFTARAIFLLTVALLSYDLATDLNLRIDNSLDSITGSAVSDGIWRRLAGDTLTGSSVAANILAAKYCGLKFGKVGPWFTYLGAFSFTLYLMHVPILRFFAGYFGPNNALSLTILVLGTAWLISRVTERQKDNIRSILRLLSARLLKTA